MSVMVDVAARAVADLGQLDLANYQHRQLIVRTVIAAMGNPTDEMKTAANDVELPPGPDDAPLFLSQGDAETVFVAMTDAALK